MKEITAYLSFDGNCREPMTFYAEYLGVDIQMMKFSEAPCTAPQEAKDRDRPCESHEGFGGSDGLGHDARYAVPSRQQFFDHDQSRESRGNSKALAALGEKGTVRMPLQDTFWNAHFGMLTDQFGVNWMFNFEKQK